MEDRRDLDPAPSARRPAAAAAAPPGAELGGPGTPGDPAQRDTESPRPWAASAGYPGYLGPESWILTSPQVSPSRTRLSKKQRRGAAGPAAPGTSARPLRGHAAGGEEPLPTRADVRRRHGHDADNPDRT